MPDPATGGTAIRASAIPVGDAAQRPHPVIHRSPGDARPGPLHPHRRDDRRDAQARRRRGHPSPEARDQRRKLSAPLLPPESTEVPADSTSTRASRSCRTAFDAFRHSVRRLVASRNEGTPPRRHLRRRDSGQAAAVVSHGIRGVLAAGATGIRRAGGRAGIGTDRCGTCAAPGDWGRPGNAAARSHCRNRGGRMAQELRRRSE